MPTQAASPSKLASMAKERMRESKLNAERQDMKNMSYAQRADLGASRNHGTAQNEPQNTSTAHTALMQANYGMGSGELLGSEALKQKGEKPKITSIPVKGKNKN